MSIERAADPSAAVSIVSAAWAWGTPYEIVQFIAACVAVIAGVVSIVANLRKIRGRNE